MENGKYIKNSQKVFPFFLKYCFPKKNQKWNLIFIVLLKKLYFQHKPPQKSWQTAPVPQYHLRTAAQRHWLPTPWQHQPIQHHPSWRVERRCYELFMIWNFEKKNIKSTKTGKKMMKKNSLLTCFGLIWDASSSQASKTFSSKIFPCRGRLARRHVEVQKSKPPWVCQSKSWRGLECKSLIFNKLFECTWFFFQI